MGSFPVKEAAPPRGKHEPVPTTQGPTSPVPQQSQPQQSQPQQSQPQQPPKTEIETDVQWYVFVRLKGEKEKVRINFEPSWTVFRFKREILNRVLAPALMKKRAIKQKGEDDEHEQDIEEIALEEREKAEENDNDKEEAAISAEVEAGVPRPEVLVLENPWIGDRLKNNRELLSNALEEILKRNVVPENDKALIIVSHPELRAGSTSPKNITTVDPYKDIEIELPPMGPESDLNQIIQSAETLLKQWKEDPLVHGQKREKKYNDDEDDRDVIVHMNSEQAHLNSERMLEQAAPDLSLAEDRARREEEKRRREEKEQIEQRLQREEEERQRAARDKTRHEKIPSLETQFVNEFLPPSTPFYLSIWVFTRFLLWAGHSYGIWAGAKFPDIMDSSNDCDVDKISDWFIVSGATNLGLLVILCGLRLCAECRRKFPRGNVGWRLSSTVIFLFVLFFFCVAWNAYGTSLLANTSCGGEIYRTLLGYVIGQWVAFTSDVISAYIGVRAHTLEFFSLQKQKKEERKWDKWIKNQKKRKKEEWVER